MKKVLWCIPMLMALLSLSCSTQWSMYADNMFHGKRLLREDEYAAARADFLKAAEAQKWPSAYAFAATASYKMGDLASAERYVMEAERLDGKDYSYVRTLGYKSLVLLKEGKEKEGMEALQQYAQVLRSISSPKGATQVEIWMRQQPMDLSALEKLIDAQVYQYESDIEQWQETGTGFYQRRGNFRAGPSITP
jgi:tetratricopeptide (TPR) repeat protein